MTIGHATTVMTMIPVHDYDRALAFYTDILGLHVTEPLPNMPPLLTTDGGHLVQIYVPNQPASPTHTLATFFVDDIVTTARTLQSKGVAFEPVEIPALNAKTDADGVMSLPSGRAAWFKDSEGNILGIFSAT